MHHKTEKVKKKMAARQVQSKKDQDRQFGPQVDRCRPRSCKSCVCLGYNVALHPSTKSNKVTTVETLLNAQQPKEALT